MTMFGYNVLGFGSGGVAPNSATGGTITASGAYSVHVFNSSGTFTPSGTFDVEYVVVAGGGGGGAPSSCSSTHLPRFTGDVRVGFEVTVKTLA